MAYFQGWGKNLSYVLAFGTDHVYDVTWRYSLDHKKTLKSRNRCRETVLARFIEVGFWKNDKNYISFRNSTNAIRKTWLQKGRLSSSEGEFENSWNFWLSAPEKTPARTSEAELQVFSKKMEFQKSENFSEQSRTILYFFWEIILEHI